MATPFLGSIARAVSLLGEQASSSLDALEKAHKYSFDTIGVGILMSYGRKNKVTAEEVGDAFVKALTKRDIRSRYYFYNTDREGMAIEFHIGYSALGPWSVQEAAGRMQEVVARTEAMKKIHGSKRN